MLRALAAVIAPLLGVLLGVALTLASVFLLLGMTVETELMDEPLQRNLAIAGTLVVGVFLLVGSVYVSTRIAVMLFGRKTAESTRATAAANAPLRPA